ncbi:MAG: YbaB/EbfC family nucleoid-associated protein [Phycisphaerae bacterium]
MFGKLGNMMSLMGNMNKIAKEYKNTMAQLKEQKVQASVGGDQVTVTANGVGEIVGIKISPDLVKTGDAGIIEEMVISGVNAAVEKAKGLAQQQMGQLAEILPLDQLKGLLGNISPEDLGK